MATLALCEALARTPNEELAAAARKAVACCLANQRQDGGFFASGKTGDARDLEQVQTSAWVYQALHAARLAGLEFDYTAFDKIMLYVDKSVRSGVGAAAEDPEGTSAAAERAVTDACAAMMLRIMHGTSPNSELLQRTAQGVLRFRSPRWCLPEGRHAKMIKWWFFASHGMHHMGGQYRYEWMERLEPLLADHQAPDSLGHQAGSWDGRRGKTRMFTKSRVAFTAMAALCLEAPTRYQQHMKRFGEFQRLDELFFE
jgi:hypothetical protein